VDLNGSTRTANINDANTDIDMEISANVTDSGMVGGITKQGAGTLKLSGTNTYPGISTVSAGTLQFGKEVSLYNNTPAQWTDANMVVESGATAAFNVDATGAGGQFTPGDIDSIKLIGTASGGFKNGSSIGLDTTNATGGSFSYSSGIADTNSGANSIGLTKLGTGNLTLGGANTYTGPTFVKAGVLEVVTTTGASTAAGLTVSSSGTVAGTGTISGALATHIVAGAVSPGTNSGAGTGTLSFEGNLTFTSGSSANYTIDNPSQAYDQIKGLTAGGTLTLDANHVVNVTAPSFGVTYTPQVGDIWQLMDWSIIAANGFNVGTDLRSGGNGGGTLNLPDLSSFGLQWSVANFTSNGAIAVVPEPGRVMLLFFGLAALFLRRRRR
jgi:autotransporter-associated beta strand protein